MAALQHQQKFLQPILLVFFIFLSFTLILYETFFTPPPNSKIEFFFLSF